MTTLKEALRLVGQTEDKQVVHIVPYDKSPLIYGEVLSVKAVREKFDLKRTYVDKIECCYPDGQFLFWEFYVYERNKNE